MDVDESKLLSEMVICEKDLEFFDLSNNFTLEFLNAIDKVSG
jgi:hypothetical protein